MGALVMMRDEPFDAPVPEQFEPDTKFHDEKLAAARDALEAAAVMTDTEGEERSAVTFNKAMAEHVAYLSDEAERMRRCKAMLERVEAWHTEAEGLREFMLDQLRRSIGDGRPYDIPPPIRLTGAAWRAAQMESASRDIAYHEVERSKVIARTEDRNRWLAALRASLPSPKEPSDV
jgi:hypothetical protein